MDTGVISDLIKTKVASLIQEHFKPIIDELAAQRRMLQTHSALLRHNHNVNDYQMARLENLRDLEQSINFKVAGALGFDPWQHPTMGTNLREPVPADPRLIPRFTPENTTPVQRAAESAELIAQAGVSARRLGVPLTLHDFPRDPTIHSGGENEDPMHAAVPLYGIRAPRWRAKEGLPQDAIPGSATYNGVPAPPAGKKGKRLYVKRAQKLNPKWKTFEAATAPKEPPSVSSMIPAPVPRPTPIPAATPIVLDGAAPSFSVEPRIASTSTASPTNCDITHAASSRSTGQSDSQRNEQIRSIAPPSTSTTTLPVPPRPSLKRSRRAAELENDEDDVGASSSSHRPVATVVPPPPMQTTPEPPVKQEDPETGVGSELEPQRKRRRRSSAPSPSPSIGLAVDTRDATGGGWPGPGQLRRSTRVTRAHACATAAATAVKPAPRKRLATANGKRATTRS